MKKRARSKLQDVKVEDCVAVFVSEFDCGKGDLPNVIGVVIEINNDMYRIGIRGGIIDMNDKCTYFECVFRTYFECVKYKFNC